MGKKVIKIGLSASEIDKAIKEVEQYKQDVLKKFDIFCDRFANEIASEAQLGFNSSLVDDIIKGGSPHTAEVTVTPQPANGGVRVIIAEGEDAIWCEFGAGVYHNGSAGSSPNPLGAELGFTIGSYGQGKGKQTAWGYVKDGEVHVTRGTPATMPMYNAVQSVLSKMVQIAKEVYG